MSADAQGGGQVAMAYDIREKVCISIPAGHILRVCGVFNVGPWRASIRGHSTKL